MSGIDRDGLIEAACRRTIDVVAGTPGAWDEWITDPDLAGAVEAHREVLGQVLPVIVEAVLAEVEALQTVRLLKQNEAEFVREIYARDQPEAEADR